MTALPDDLDDANDPEAFNALIRDQDAVDTAPLVEFLPKLLQGQRRQVLESPLAGVDGVHYTDVGNADRLIAAYGEQLRYVPIWGRWLVFSGGRFRLDHGDTLVSHLVAEVARDLLQRIGEVRGDTKATGDLIRWIRRTESAAGISATLTVAATRPGVAIDHEALDANPWLLNVTNGTVNLRTGVLQDHSPTDLLTMRANVAYQPNAQAPQWTGFIAQILPDTGVARFVQRLAGLALLGLQLEHLLVILLGFGANGKSTLTKVFASVLGDYAVVASRDVLLALKHDSHPTAKADLFRRRLAHSGELPPAAKLDEAQVKELTGGDRIKARRMREDFWEFDPSHLLWLHANHRPLIEGTDDGIWRRVILVPFEVQILVGERDPHLADRILRDEAPGVFAWMLSGLADYLEHGLQIPDTVSAATQAYRNESDTVAAFFTETNIIFDDTKRWITTTDLLAAHGEWFAAAGPAESEKAHYQRVVTALKERGITQRRDRQRGRYWPGVGMASEQGCTTP